MPIPMNDLRSALERFVEGTDRSMTLAGEIESALDQQFGDEEPFASAALALASYRPEGGPFLYAEADMVPILRQVLSALDHQRDKT